MDSNYWRERIWTRFVITGSDDDEEEEGSTAAMDGSALRTPPADAEPIEPGSGGGSESG